MTIADSTQLGLTPFPDHTQLPESDGTFVFAERAGGKNFQEHPQSILLTDSIKPILEQIHPDEQYAIGQDCGIYWRLTEPPEKGAEAPDWFYVPNVPPTLDGEFRRSYVLWREFVAPLIVIEFVSGDGSEERDQTPLNRNQPSSQKPGKFWVYERIIRPAFYAIYEVEKASVEVYYFVGNNYELVAANERGHYPILQMGVELGIWQGCYGNMELPWLRWWDSLGNLLLTGEERAETERQRAELAELDLEQQRQQTQQEQQRAETERQRAERAELELEQQRQRAEQLAELLRSQGINLEDVE